MLRAIKPIPKGIIVYAFLLILGSLYKLFCFIDYDYYVFMFQQTSVGHIHDRYIVSVAYRIVGLIVAVGLMCHKNWARQMMLLLCVVTILTIYWKHPYSVFENIAIYFEYEKGINGFPSGTITDQFIYPLYPENLGNYTLVNPSHPKISRIFHSLIDFLFCGWGVYYLTRPAIKKYFLKS